MNFRGRNSIGLRLVVVALIPLVVFLPLALRNIAGDVQEWQRAGDRLAAADQFSKLTTAEEAVRAEWFAGIFATSTNFDSVASDSTIYEDRVGEIGEQRQERVFSDAVGVTDRALTALAASWANEIEIDRSGLSDMRERVSAQAVIPAEVDLFYSRLLTDVEAANDVALGVMAETGRNSNPVAQAQEALSVVSERNGRLRQLLPLAVDRLLVGGTVEWSELEAAAGELVAASAELDALGFVGDASWQSAKSIGDDTATDIALLAAASGVVSEQSVADIAVRLLSDQDQLELSAQQVVETRRALAETLVTGADAERVAARNSLLLTGLLLGLATVISVFAALRARRSIALPLQHVADLAQRVNDGEIPDERVDASHAPIEVQEVAGTISNLVDTVATIEEQALELSRGAIDSPKLNRRLPGRLGEVLESSIGVWRSTTVQLDHELAHDALTGVASRRGFLQAAEACATESSLVIALIALDRFKDINDESGRACGDTVLREIASRLAAHAPDDALVGRLWSDEFGVLLPDCDIADAHRAITELVQNIADPVVTDQAMYVVSVTAGIAASDELDSALTNASLAVRSGKQVGGGVVVAHDDAFEADLNRRSRIEAELSEAIRNDELSLWFQPVIDIATGTVVGAEALVRWRLPDGSMRHPGDFIGVAEQSELILELDRWVIGTACRYLAAWESGPLGSIELAVNVSGRHLSQGDLVATVIDACGRHRVDPSRLAIEITESYLADDQAVTREILGRLDAIGVCLLIDDFGTGYSSLSRLPGLPFDVLKIDRSFVAGMRDEQGRPIVASVIAMCEALGMTALAEGVEEESELTMLAEMGCTLAQGFGICVPLDSDDALANFVREAAHVSQHS